VFLKDKHLSRLSYMIPLLSLSDNNMNLSEGSRNILNIIAEKVNRSISTSLFA